MFIQDREQPATIVVDESSKVTLYQRDEETYRLPLRGSLINRLVADLHAGTAFIFPCELPDK